MPKDVILTPEGLEKLKEELEVLSTEKRREVAERIKEARENAAKAGVNDRTRFVEKNLFEADIKDATVVTLYLLPGVNEKLKPRLLAELKPGTRVVSHRFSMPDWEPVKTIEVDGRTIYLWIIPEKGKQKQ